MKINEDKKFIINDNSHFDIEEINRYHYAHPNETILVEVANTKGISSEQLKMLEPSIYVRVAGAYNKDMVQWFKNTTFTDGETGEYFYTSVIYTRNELISIVNEMEQIESGIQTNWSDLQKLIYVYKELQSKISYDHKHEEKSSEQIRSLRGLILKETVCAGYALILQEMMDRQGIRCEFTVGKTDDPGHEKHAWNIVTIEGKEYNLDLTWDSSRFHSTGAPSYYYLGQNSIEFASGHRPDFGVNARNMLDPELINYIDKQINTTREYLAPIHKITRKDGSQFYISQMKKINIGNYAYYPYCYYEPLDNGKIAPPSLFYARENLEAILNSKDTDQATLMKQDALINDLFSKDNINDSKKNYNRFLGALSQKFVNSKFDGYVVAKDKKISGKSRHFNRNDGTTIMVAEELFKKTTIRDKDIFQYNTFELLKENDRYVTKQNTVFTEHNLTEHNYNDQELANVYFSRKRIDERANQHGGYIGYVEKPGTIQNNYSTAYLVNPNKPLHVNLFRDKVPAFDELKTYLIKYKIDCSFNKLTGEEEYFVKDKISGERLYDPGLFSCVAFAELWKSAHDNVYENDSNPFNRVAETLYYDMYSTFCNSVQKTGVIDTVGFFKGATNWEYDNKTRDVIVNLLNNDRKVEFLNNLFLSDTGQEEGNGTPIVLPSIEEARRLAANYKK